MAVIEIDYEKEILIKQRNLELFYKIVGESPLDQIDWIIEHGLNKFNYWFRLYETNKIYNPATVEEYIESQFEIRGGLGNQRIDGGYQLREYDRKSGTWRVC